VLSTVVPSSSAITLNAGVAEIGKHSIWLIGRSWSVDEVFTVRLRQSSEVMSTNPAYKLLPATLNVLVAPSLATSVPLVFGVMVLMVYVTAGRGTVVVNMATTLLVVASRTAIWTVEPITVHWKIMKPLFWPKDLASAAQPLIANGEA